MKTKFIVIISIAVITIAGIVGYLLFQRSQRQLVEFFGLVIDENGQPVAGAEVILHWSHHYGGDGGFYRPKPDTEVREKRTSDARGRFSVRASCDYFQVTQISKPGYEWVHETFRAPELAPTELIDNRFYAYGMGGYTYLPDESRPAVFPLFRQGSAVVGKPSRGGADRYPDGRLVVNEPRSALVPSAGGGAPKTREERDERLRALATRPTTPR